MKSKFINYWQWFFIGSGHKPGYRRLLNGWFFVHLIIGIVIASLVPASLKEAANAVLLPLAGIFIGLSFAWAGNAHALIESREIEKLSEYHEGGFVEYIFVYQTAILTIMTTLVLWGFAGLNVFDEKWPTVKSLEVYFLIKTILFTFSSLTLRECWHVVLGTQLMLLVKKEIKDGN